MFRIAELGRKVSHTEYDEREPVLREGLLAAQAKLRKARFPVIVLFAGVDGAGKSETANLLNAWMDPRWIVTRAYGDPSDEERDRPEFWRYWRHLPRRGQIGLFLSAWYSDPLIQRVYGRISPATFDRRLERISLFEKTLVDDGALILKFWMHLGKDAQKRRFRTLEKDPLQKWRVTKKDWKHWKMYDEFIGAAERLIMRTSTGEAPWRILEGQDHRYRSLEFGNRLLARLEERLAREDTARKTGSHPAPEAPSGATTAVIAQVPPAARSRSRGSRHADLNAAVMAEDISADALTATDTATSTTDNGVEEAGSPEARTILSNLDTSLNLPKKKYDRGLVELQGRINLLSRRIRETGLSAILVFEGWDAAGKGGAIRRITHALDARDYQVIPIAAPTEDELAHHYLWRFWRHLPRAGRITIFDRSWYGRVLVERVEGLASPSEWRRAYAEINQFESELIESGTVLIKFWMHISREEQETRFRGRQRTAYKSWKLTDEDWRNRGMWDQYELAVNDMVERTSTRIAPWVLVEANDKRYARIKVLRELRRRLTKVLA